MSMSAEVSPNEKSPRAAPTPAEVEPTTPASLSSTLERMKRAQIQQGSPSLKERVRRLEALERAVLDHEDAICSAMREDFGNKARTEARLSEIYLVVSAIRHAKAHVREWMEPESRELPWPVMPAQGEVIPQPVGVVGIVSPWNYPINLALVPLTGALAAGCRAMLKPSELAPKTSQMLADLIRSAFDPDVVTVVQGDAKVGEEFSNLPFDHLVFTGSTRIGRVVMKAASENLVPVTLELGGKSPVILGPDVDLGDAVWRIMAGKIWNAGQTCICPDYVLLPKRQFEPFVAEAKKAIASMLPRIVDNPDYTSIISPRHHARLSGLVDEAKQKGARVEVLNPSGETVPSESRKMAPVLIVDANETMTLMQEEIFGPILPLVASESLDESIAFVNERPRPLALYYFGRKREHQDRVIDRTRSGGVTINDTMFHAAADELPFGGIGASGMGAYHGRDGFLTFTKMRPVFYQSRLNPRRMLAPPFGKAVEALLRLLIGK